MVSAEVAVAASDVLAPAAVQETLRSSMAQDRALIRRGGEMVPLEWRRAEWPWSLYTPNNKIDLHVPLRCGCYYALARRLATVVVSILFLMRGL